MDDMMICAIFSPKRSKRCAFLMQVMIPQGQRSGVLGER